MNHKPRFLIIPYGMVRHLKMEWSGIAEYIIKLKMSLANLRGNAANQETMKPSSNLRTNLIGILKSLRFKNG